MFQSHSQTENIRRGSLYLIGIRIFGFLLLLLMATQAHTSGEDERSGSTSTRSPYVIYEIHDGNYRNGELIKLRIGDRVACLIRPTSKIDKQRRWVWVAPIVLIIPDPNQGGEVPHKFYVESLLEAGFHVGAVCVGTSCGSPKGVEVCEAFYNRMIDEYELNQKVRVVAQSNGGLVMYSWAYRHPTRVDRVFGIYPVTDMTSWPGLNRVIGPRQYPEPELSFDLTLQQLKSRYEEYNPIDNLKPLASADVKILHIHGDRDKYVPAERHTIEFARRYRALGGQIEYEIFENRAHGPSGEEGADPTLNDLIFYLYKAGRDFLLE